MNLEIKDGGEVDVLWRPDNAHDLKLGFPYTQLKTQITGGILFSPEKAVEEIL